MEYTTNKEYKDRLFCFLFGNEKYKKYTLSLYNALNNVHYTAVEDLQLVTIKDTVYIRMHNDVAVMLSGNMELYEQQSTVNPNMPIRGLIYFAHEYEKYIKAEKRSIYGRTLVDLPTPKYVVFYNGTENRPAIEKLRLSDAFCNTDESGEFEWTATVMNLNHADNAEFLGKCEMLKEYTGFVQEVNRFKKTMGEAEAIDAAVQVYIARGGELADILEMHRAEVTGMLLQEFDEEVFVRSIKEEGREEGIEEGIRKVALNMLSSGVPAEMVAKYSDLPLDEVEELQKKV